MASEQIWHDLDGVRIGVLKNWRLNPLPTTQRLQLGSTLGAANIGLPVFDTDMLVQFFWSGATWVAGTTGGDGGTPLLGYIHTQAIASDTWTVNHGLGYKPGGILVEDSSDRFVFGGEVQYVDNNNLIITFSAGFAGKAYIS